MGDKKIDLTESRMRDDHRPAKGLRYPIFDAVIMFLEFLHNLDPQEPFGLRSRKGLLSVLEPPLATFRRTTFPQSKRSFRIDREAEGMSWQTSLYDIRLHDAAQLVDALDEKRLERRIPDLLGEAACLVVKSVMHRLAGDGSNPFVEIDDGSA